MLFQIVASISFWLYFLSHWFMAQNQLHVIKKCASWPLSGEKVMISQQDSEVEWTHWENSWYDVDHFIQSILIAEFHSHHTRRQHHCPTDQTGRRRIGWATSRPTTPTSGSWSSWRRTSQRSMASTLTTTTKLGSMLLKVTQLTISLQWAAAIILCVFYNQLILGLAWSFA